ncbi:hypothetical protein HNP38_001140 [Chryseobacterium defluvii]|uniref:Uncharacterized protein n=1 Tax=Chryseobacterium defluvii TaxID=160396 RepID=A0A840KCY1_9FLAO|nr:hypothetical protein [Chryseobacterium defluvii]MBB4805868.1 hypothetical protein [Chryseobacterium defluvii]
MKQFYKSKSLLRLSFLFIVLFSAFSLVSSCKDDDDEEYTDHIVQFEAKIVNGGPSTPPPTTFSKFKTVVTQVGTVSQTYFDPAGFTWSSGEFFVNSSQAQLNLAANAELLHADSKLTINIWVDGEIAKTVTVTGSGTKSVSLAHSFLEL